MATLKENRTKVRFLLKRNVPIFASLLRRIQLAWGIWRYMTKGFSGLKEQKKGEVRSSGQRPREKGHAKLHRSC